MLCISFGQFSKEFSTDKDKEKKTIDKSENEFTFYTHTLAHNLPLILIVFHFGTMKMFTQWNRIKSNQILWFHKKKLQMKCFAYNPYVHCS